jgi:copper(I)-binding protein
MIRTVIAAALLGVSAFASPVSAHEYRAGGLHIDHPWARATPPGAQVAGGYVRITNEGAETDRLIGGGFSASARVEIHEMRMEGEVMKMAELPQGLEIPPGATVELKPGGYHVMFMGLTRPLTEGESVSGELVFEKAGRVAVDFAVEAIGAKGEHDHGEHDHGGHAGHEGHGAPKASP